jgi:hypothetical protein
MASPSVLADTLTWNTLPAILGVLAAFAGGLISLITARNLQEPQKRIGWDILSNSTIKAYDVEAVKNILEKYPGKNIRFVIIRLSNVGRVAIEAEDYIAPITFEFRGVLGSELAGIEPKEPGSSHIRVFSDKNVVEVDKLPISPKEDVIISIIVIGIQDSEVADSNIRVSGRILHGQIVGSNQ